MNFDYISNITLLLFYIHTENQSNEKDGRYLSLVHILSKLAMNVPKGYPVSSTEEESPLERYKQRRYQKHATGNNEMAEEFGQDKLLTSGRNLGPFAMLYALQSSVPERNPSMEGVDGITRRSSDRSSRWRKWFWNGGRATGIRRKFLLWEYYNNWTSI